MNNTSLNNNSDTSILDANGEFIGSSNDEQGYLSLGVTFNVDWGGGYDVLRMLNGRSNVHLETKGNALEVTNISDGAVLSMVNAEAIAFDSGETVIITHNVVESILARLVNTFLNRDISIEEWQVGRQILINQIEPQVLFDWFQEQANLGQLSDTEYIQTLVQNTLKRPATAAEVNDYLAQLNDGTLNRDWVAVDIAHSEEAAAVISSIIELDNAEENITKVELSTVEQNTSNLGFVINGVSARDYSGTSVSNAGDVNGDGLDDLIVGAPGDDPHGHNSGASFVVFGKTNSTAVELSSIETGTGGFVINVASSYDHSGVSVSTAGDVNGDGFDDLIVGTYPSHPNRYNSGASFVVFGKANSTAVERSSIETSTPFIIETGTGGFVINGASDHDYSGSSVSTAGDVNGDGLDDLIVGAARDDPNGSSSGASFVVFGKTDAATIELSNIETGNGGFVINGVSEGDSSGRSVSTAGDVNGDGFDDLIIGAKWDDPNGKSRASFVVLGETEGTAAKLSPAPLLPPTGNSGASFVVFGKTDGTAVELSSIEMDGAGGFVINGVSEGDSSGRSVSTAGDVNGDGFDDLIVGADGDDPNGSNSGASFVVFGKTDGTAVELSSIETGNGGFVINGVSEGDSSGRSVSTAGDVNGDGFDDLIVGAGGDDPNGSNSGASFVVFGKTDAAAVELSSIETGTGGFVINGANAGDYSGGSVSTAGDVNGDGFDDLIVGARRDDPNGYASGASFVVFGGQGSSATVGTNNDDTLTGDSSANQLVAGRGNDTLLGNGGADVLRGGSGNDTLAITDLNFASLDGGTGTDTLRFDAALTLDLRSLADNKLNSIEIIDLSADGGNSTLSLNITDLININESQTSSNTLVIHGDAGDAVNLDNNSNGQVGIWTEVGNIHVYEFTAADGGIGLIGTVTIDTDVTVTIVA